MNKIFIFVSLILLTGCSQLAYKHQSTLSTQKMDILTTGTSTELSFLNEKTMNLFGEPATEVVDFLFEIQNSLAMEDKPGLANLIKYPITIHLINEEDLEIHSAEEFIANYEKIVSPKLKEIVLSQDPAELFVNWKGVMINRGELWFGPVCLDSPDCKEREFFIYAITVDTPW